MTLIRERPFLLADTGPFCRFAEGSSNQLHALAAYLGGSIHIVHDVWIELHRRAKTPEHASLKQLEWIDPKFPQHESIPITDRHVSVCGGLFVKAPGGGLKLAGVHVCHQRDGGHMNPGGLREPFPLGPFASRPSSPARLRVPDPPLPHQAPRDRPGGRDHAWCRAGACRRARQPPGAGAGVTGPLAGACGLADEESKQPRSNDWPGISKHLPNASDRTPSHRFLRREMGRPHGWNAVEQDMVDGPHRQLGSPRGAKPIREEHRLLGHPAPSWACFGARWRIS